MELKRREQVPVCGDFVGAIAHKRVRLRSTDLLNLKGPNAIRHLSLLSIRVPAWSQSVTGRIAFLGGALSVIRA